MSELDFRIFIIRSIINHRLEKKRYRAANVNRNETNLEFIFDLFMSSC